jgi:hypothetical protein
MLELTAIAFSPWSEKARWALDHHRCDYRELAYEPIVGEYVLRWQMRRPFGRLTVPVLRDGDRCSPTRLTSRATPSRSAAGRRSSRSTGSRRSAPGIAGARPPSRRVARS